MDSSLTRPDHISTLLLLLRGETPLAPPYLIEKNRLSGFGHRTALANESRPPNGRTAAFISCITPTASDSVAAHQMSRASTGNDLLTAFIPLAADVAAPAAPGLFSAWAKPNLTDRTRPRRRSAPLPPLAGSHAKAI